MDDAYTGARAPADSGQARQVVGEATDAATEAAGNVADSAKYQARRVTGEVTDQARSVAAELRDQVGTQVRSQNDRLVDGIRRMADELDGMTADGGDSPARAVVSRVAQGGRQMADYLADRGPEGVLEEVSDFARRRPGAFLATALATGFVVGRLGKGVFKAETETATPTPTSTGASTGDGFIPRMRTEPSVSVSAEPPLSTTAYDYPTVNSEPEVGTEYLATGTGRPTPVTEPIGAGVTYERGVSNGTAFERGVASGRSTGSQADGDTLGGSR